MDQQSGMIKAIRDLRETNERGFYCVQAVLLTFAWYFGTFPYQVTQGSVFDSMWLPLAEWLNAPWLWLTTGSFLLMLSLLTFKEFQDLLSTRWAQFLGRTSFAIYLLHFIVLILADILIMPYLGPSFNKVGHHDRTGAAFFTFFLVIVPVVLTASHYFYVYVDEPSIQLSKDFTDLWFYSFPRFCGCLHQKKSDPSNSTKHASIVVHPVNDGDDKLTSMVVNSDVEQAVSPEQLGLPDAGADAVAAARTEKKSFSYRDFNWTSKNMILMYIMIAFFIPCCIPYNKTNTCYVNDDNK
jgi:hypothetical protein